MQDRGNAYQDEGPWNIVVVMRKPVYKVSQYAHHNHGRYDLAGTNGVKGWPRIERRLPFEACASHGRGSNNKSVSERATIA